MTQQVALITGSSRGIGRAAALALSRNSFAVAINGRTKSAGLLQTVDEINAHGGRAIEVVFDVADISSHTEVLNMIEDKLGGITTLVNNAGVSVVSRGDLLDSSEASFDSCFETNTKGPFFLSQNFAQRLLSKERTANLHYSLINVSSVNAEAVAVMRAEYCASKAALAMISKCFAVRLGSENIPVFDVQPGLIETDMTAGVIEEYKKRAADGLCLFPRVGSASEIGEVIASLATNRLPYTTGHVIRADGGMLIQRF